MEQKNDVKCIVSSGPRVSAQLGAQTAVRTAHSLARLIVADDIPMIWYNTHNPHLAFETRRATLHVFTLPHRTMITPSSLSVRVGRKP